MAKFSSLLKALQIHDRGLKWESQVCHNCCSSWKPGKPAWHYDHCIFHAEGQAEIEGCGYPPKQRELLALVARLEGEVAAKDAALRNAEEWIAVVEVAKMPGAGDTQTYVLHVIQAALSDAGEGWLPGEAEKVAGDAVVMVSAEIGGWPEVREQVREALRRMTWYLRGLVIWNHGGDEKKWPADKESVVLVRAADAALAALGGK